MPEVRHFVCDTLSAFRPAAAGKPFVIPQYFDWSRTLDAKRLAKDRNSVLREDYALLYDFSIDLQILAFTADRTFGVNRPKIGRRKNRLSVLQDMRRSVC